MSARESSVKATRGEFENLSASVITTRVISADVPEIDFGNVRIANIGKPKNPTDAVTKEYVDDLDEELGSKINAISVEMNNVILRTSSAVSDVDSRNSALKERVEGLDVTLRTLVEDEVKTINNNLGVVAEELNRHENAISVFSQHHKDMIQTVAREFSEELGSLEKQITSKAEISMLIPRLEFAAECVDKLKIEHHDSEEKLTAAISRISRTLDEQKEVMGTAQTQLGRIDGLDRRLVDVEERIADIPALIERKLAAYAASTAGRVETAESIDNFVEESKQYTDESILELKQDVELILSKAKRYTDTAVRKMDATPHKPVIADLSSQIIVAPWSGIPCEAPVGARAIATDLNGASFSYNGKRWVLQSPVVIHREFLVDSQNPTSCVIATCRIPAGIIQGDGDCIDVSAVFGLIPTLYSQTQYNISVTIAQSVVGGAPMSVTTMAAKTHATTIGAKDAIESKMIYRDGSIFDVGLYSSEALSAASRGKQINAIRTSDLHVSLVVTMPEALVRLLTFEVSIESAW